MTREELWAEYVRQNPSFAGEQPVTITPQSIRKMFDLTWDISAKREAAFRSRSASIPPGFGGIFQDIFGG